MVISPLCFVVFG